MVEDVVARIAVCLFLGVATFYTLGFLGGKISDAIKKEKLNQSFDRHSQQ